MRSVLQSVALVASLTMLVPGLARAAQLLAALGRT
jgi:hypothetical protein